MDEREQTLRDKEEAVKIFRRIDFCRELFTVGVFASFLLTKILKDSGILVVNGTLIVLTLIYAIAISVRYFIGFRKNWGAYMKTAYKGIKIGYSLVAVGIAVYSVVTAVNQPSALEIILAVLSVALLIIKIVIMAIAAALQAKLGGKKSAETESPQEEAQNPVSGEESVSAEAMPPNTESAATEEAPQNPPQEEPKKKGFFGWLFGKIPDDENGKK